MNNTSILEQELDARLKECTQLSEKESESIVRFDPAFRGFDGHFEGNPIVPGVCLVQMIRIHMQRLTEETLILSEVSQCRFRSPVLADMSVCNKVKILSASDGEYMVQADVAAGDVPVCRMKLKMRRSAV